MAYDTINNETISVISNIVKNDKVSHALLFEVNDCDKSMAFIKNIAKIILCNKKDKNFDNLNCNQCNICKLIDEDNYPDLVVLSTDGNWIKKKQLVDLQDDFNNKSLLNNKRIYIIKEAEKLNASSSNSLLKFLEEPGDDIIAILVTKNRYLLLDTIQSRCQIFNLKSMNLDFDEELKEKLDNFLEYVAKKRNLFVYYRDIVDNIFIDKPNTIKLLSEIEKYFMYYLTNDKKDDNISDSLNRISLDEMILYVKIIEKEKQKLEYNLNYKIWVDSFFSRIIGEVYG